MTRRKPSGVSWESWVERQIRDAQQRGEFDGLPGAGKPIADLQEPYDELWWVKRKLRREHISGAPPSVAIRREREQALERIASATSEAEVRRLVARVNLQIRTVNASTTSGPPTNVMPLDVDRVLARWRDSSS